MDCLSGEGLVLLGAVGAIQLSQGKSAEELGVLAAFFTILGDNLAMLALTVPGQGACQERDVNGTDTLSTPVVVP